MLNYFVGQIVMCRCPEIALEVSTIPPSLSFSSLPFGSFVVTDPNDLYPGYKVILFVPHLQIFGHYYGFFFLSSSKNKTILRELERFDQVQTYLSEPSEPLFHYLQPIEGHCYVVVVFFVFFFFQFQFYTLLQKKRNFSRPIFPGDPGSLTLNPDHVYFVKWF